MSKLDTLQGRALELAGQVGDGVRHVIPAGAGKWLQTGAVLGVARTGAKTAGHVVRRNPTLAVAAAIAVGAGLALYAIRRRQRKANGRAGGATIEGRSKRVEADRTTKRPARKAASRRAPGARKGAEGAETGA
ncbi:hypothetical protein [Luteimonas sp. R10]|uniref:hypothetical protein n=1 Tax=Luteimonas sp. R10 TaxID=3108176 RepID=UPI003084EE9B|nr:hypothetical protein U3649_02860 [Luteimonas sp. R10]